VIAPPPPDGEAARLAALQELRILDTPEEERFDRVTRLARRLFGVPIALVSLVDADRQWFKSRDGLAASSTSRAVSFCGHAINQEAPLVVPNAVEDDRFHDNPLVTGDPKIRFYAGHPLRVRGGHRIGTLCVIDRAPREFSEDELASLADLAGMIEDQINRAGAATADPLTGLLNRHALSILAAPLLAGARRNRAPVSLAYLDLDKFKQINDTHGHAAGDEALRRFAAALHATFRQSDVVARLGGDEFCVLASGNTKASLAPALDRLAEAVAAAHAGLPYPIQYSVGLAEALPDAPPADLTGLLARADEAMYAQKTRGPPFSGLAS